MEGFISQGMKSTHIRKSGHNRLNQLIPIIIPNYLVPTFVMFKNIDKKHVNGRCRGVEFGEEGGYCKLFKKLKVKMTG